MTGAAENCKRMQRDANFSHFLHLGVPQGTKMDFPESAAMAPTRTIAHRIDEHSPLYGKTLADILNDGPGSIHLTISATDDHTFEVRVS